MLSRRFWLAEIERALSARRIVWLSGVRRDAFVRTHGEIEVQYLPFQALPALLESLRS
jgi:hypothetical protein